MNVCVIYDKKGKCPCFANVVPNKEVFIRELSLSCKGDNVPVYAIYPEDYLLVEIDLSSGTPVGNFVEFTDFLSKEVESHVKE